MMEMRVAKAGNFDINRIGDELQVTDAGGEWARFSVYPFDDSDTIGSAVIGLFGSGNPDPNDQASLFELAIAARIQGEFGISYYVNTLLLPRLAIKVITPHGSGSVKCNALIMYQPSNVQVFDQGEL